MLWAVTIHKITRTAARMRHFHTHMIRQPVSGYYIRCIEVEFLNSSIWASLTLTDFNIVYAEYVPTYVSIKAAGYE